MVYKTNVYLLDFVNTDSDNADRKSAQQPNAKGKVQEITLLSKGCSIEVTLYITTVITMVAECV